MAVSFISMYKIKQLFGIVNSAGVQNLSDSKVLFRPVLGLFLLDPELD